MSEIAVTVCNACGSDMCWQGRAMCDKSRGAGTIEVPACRNMDDRTGRQCLRPEKVHTSGWSHAFLGESTRPKAPPPPLTLTFDGWRGIIAKQTGCQDCIFDEAEGGVIDHCHNCCLAIIGDAWRHFQGQPRASRSADAKVTHGEATLTLGPVAGVFAEATGDATAEVTETPPQRVKASHSA